MTATRRLSNIVFETDRHWVERTEKGFKIWEIGPVGSKHVSTCGYQGDKGLAWCKAEIERRETAQ